MVATKSVRSVETITRNSFTFWSYLKHYRADERVRASGTRFIEASRRLTGNTPKSAVDRPWKRRLLGFMVSRHEAKLKVADKVIDKKAEVRGLIRRPCRA